MSFKFVLPFVTFGLFASAQAFGAPSNPSAHVVRNNLTGQIISQTIASPRTAAPIGLAVEARVVRDNLTGQIAVNMAPTPVVELARDSQLRVMRDNLTGQVFLARETPARAGAYQF